MATKEKYSGTWAETGQEVSFNREWGSKRFSDAECESLLRGETLEFTAVSARTGNEYSAKGKLEAQSREIIEDDGEEKTIRWIGFRNAAFDPKLDDQGRQVPPDSFSGHDFTDEEKEKLINGESLYLDDLWSTKKEKPYQATVSFDYEPGGNQEKKKIIPQFGN